jgi:glycine/D-amino acid oxidase-like deaminating enzyme
MQAYVTEPERKIPVERDVDVVVAGAGPAGFSAAVCAAREGARTVLIEQSGSVGGVATTGLMSHWAGRTQPGFFEEVIERSYDLDENHRVINPEKLKTVMLDMLREAGVELYLYNFVSQAVMEGNQLKGAITESKSGRRAFLGKVFVDATGDGDLAARAGAPFYKGRESDGRMQPVTLMFKVAGVDMENAVLPCAFEDERKVPLGMVQELGRKHLTHPAGHVLLYKASLPGVVTVNMTNCTDIDGTNADDLTKAEYVCRGQIEPIIDFLHKFVPGFENCYPISSASQMGVRETRHFVGEYTLHEEDLRNARFFDDWVVANSQFSFDIHNVEGSGLDANGEQAQFRQANGYTIPYRCLLPKEIEGLILAGRCISSTHKAHSNFRVMPICASIGEAAGIAAALAAKKSILPRELDAKEVQAVLAASGIQP